MIKYTCSTHVNMDHQSLSCKQLQLLLGVYPFLPPKSIFHDFLILKTKRFETHNPNLNNNNNLK